MRGGYDEGGGGEDANRDGAGLSHGQGFNIQSMFTYYTLSDFLICIIFRVVFI